MYKEEHAANEKPKPHTKPKNQSESVILIHFSLLQKTENPQKQHHTHTLATHLM